MPNMPQHPKHGTTVSFRDRNMRTGIRTDPLPGRQHLLAQADIGWEIYSASRALGDVEHAIGGVIIDTAITRTVDDDTGEVLERVRFQIYDPFVADHLAYGWVDQADVDPDRIQPPSRTTCWVIIGRLCRQIGASKHAWPAPKDIERLTVAMRLARVIT